MRRIRVIPVLQIENRRLVKTRRFKSPAYIGDPLNAIRIFNDKLVDEIVVVDTRATANKQSPDFDFISELSDECFMPISYGGGITSLEQAARLFKSGVEKVILGTAFHHDPGLATKIAAQYGAQSVVVSIDVKNRWLQSEKVYVNNGTSNTRYSPLEYAKRAEEKGAGEIILQSIDREGTGEGYQIALIETVSRAVSIPVIALGGANSIEDFHSAACAGASAVAAGKMFAYKGNQKAVLINYPDPKTLTENLYQRL
jgi:imidazole glycerol-phosphate synthase subunit HisF